MTVMGTAIVESWRCPHSTHLSETVWVGSIVTLSDHSGGASQGRVLEVSAHLTETSWGFHSVLYLSGVSSGPSHGGVLEVSTQHTP